MILLVYVPMVLLSSAHVHSLPSADDMPDCDLCATSVHHSGHITAITVAHDECLMCRVLNTPIDIPDETQCFIDNQVFSQPLFTQIPAVAQTVVGHPALRAPPVIL